MADQHTLTTPASEGVAVADVFVPPSPEARFLVRHFGGLLAPRTGRGGLLARLLAFAVIAPFTQFTLLSFDLQAFLFEVFHTTRTARTGHFVFMLGVNFFAMAALAQFGAPLPGAHAFALRLPTLATAYALVLLVWYAFIARERRMWGWWALMVPVVALLWTGANAWLDFTFTLEPAARSLLAPTPLAFNPWLGMLVSASLIALSHTPEPRQPPRFTDPWRWRSLREYLLGAPGEKRPAARVAGRLVLVGLQMLTGTLNEWWASPRLMPYNFLLLMFRFGYRPEERARLAAFVDRAMASGNPALDFVGTGGGAFIPRES